MIPRNTHSTCVTCLQLVNMSVTHTQENCMHNLQCQTNCLVTIDVKSGLQKRSIQGCLLLRLSHILARLELSFRNWKPAKNAFNWNISDPYANVGKFSEHFRKRETEIEVWWDFLKYKFDEIIVPLFVTHHLLPVACHPPPVVCHP